MNRRDWDALERLFASSYVHHSSPEQDMSLEELTRIMVGTMATFPDLHAEINELIAEDDKVMVRWAHSSEFMGIPPTGKHIAWSGINIFRVANGRILEDTPYWDFSVILRQLQDAP